MIDSGRPSDAAADEYGEDHPRVVDEDEGGGEEGGRRRGGDSLGHEMDRLPGGWTPEGGRDGSGGVWDRWELAVGMKACEKRVATGEFPGRGKESVYSERNRGFLLSLTGNASDFGSTL